MLEETGPKANSESAFDALTVCQSKTDLSKVDHIHEPVVQKSTARDMKTKDSFEKTSYPDSFETSEEYEELNRVALVSRNSQVRRELPFLKEITMLRERMKATEDSLEDSLEEPPVKWCTPFIEPSTEILLDSLEDHDQHMEFSDEDGAAADACYIPH